MSLQLAMISLVEIYYSQRVEFFLPTQLILDSNHPALTWFGLNLIILGQLNASLETLVQEGAPLEKLTIMEINQWDRDYLHCFLAFFMEEDRGLGPMIYCWISHGGDFCLI